MTSNDANEGHADGIAGRPHQTRPGDVEYLLGYMQGSLERLALQIAEVKREVEKALPRVTPPPIPHAMQGD